MYTSFRFFLAIHHMVCIANNSSYFFISYDASTSLTLTIPFSVTKCNNSASETSIKLRCHVPACHLSTSFFPYFYFAIRYDGRADLAFPFCKRLIWNRPDKPSCFLFLFFYRLSHMLIFRLVFFCPRLPVGGVFFYVFHIKLLCRRVPYLLIGRALLPFFFFSGCD